MKTKLLFILLLSVCCSSVRAQVQQLTDENSNTWEYLETARGEEWNEIFFQHGDNPWASAHNDWWSFKKIYIYYRQIGNRMLLRLTPDFNHDLYYVQNTPYYGTNDRYGRGQFEYRAKVSMARTVYFNL